MSSEPMGWWKSLFTQSAPVARKFRGDAIAANLQALRTSLGAEACIRMYVDGGGGAGQQAAAVNLLGRIAAPADANPAGLGYRGDGKLVEIIYDQTVATTLTNLQSLLDLGDQTQGIFRGVAVMLIALRDTGPLAQVGYSFSAATDQEQNYATACKANWHLRFQPFTIAKPEQIQQDGSDQYIDLHAQPQLGGDTFPLHGFSVPTTALAPNDWVAFEAAAQGDALRKIQVIKAILDGQFSASGNPPNKFYDVLFTYGIHTRPNRNGRQSLVNAIGPDATGQVVELTLGVMATQVDKMTGQRPDSAPAVIVNLDDFWYDDDCFSAFEIESRVDNFSYVKQQLAGAPTPAQTLRMRSTIESNRRQAGQILAGRRDYLAAVGLTDANAVADRFASLDFTLDNVTAASVAQTLKNFFSGASRSKRVLWVQLAPGLPTQLFNALLGRSTLPAVFEGANTANQALNFGNIYYHVNRPGDRGVRYPSVVLQRNPGDPRLRALQNAADQVGTKLTDWPVGGDLAGTSYPPEVFAAPFLALRGEPGPPSPGPYGTYFAQVAAFFSDPNNDKYNLGFAFLAHQVQQGHQLRRTASVGTALEALEDDADPLGALEAALTANLSGGTLKLIPGALDATGEIGKLLGALFAAGGQSWTLQGATVTADPGSPPFKTVTVKGGFSLTGSALSLEADFTAPAGVLTASVSATGSVAAFPWAPWVPIQSASLTVAAANDGGIPAIGVACVLQWPGGAETLTLSFPLPLADSAFKLSGTFEPKLSLDLAFKMAGGLNPVAQLPAPFSAAAQFGLASAELVYDTNARELSSATFDASYSGDPVTLWGKVVLDEIDLVITASTPADLKNRQTNAAIKSQFTIGAGANPGVVKIGAALPNMVFSGELAGGEIALDDLIEFFTLGVRITPDTDASIDALSFNYDCGNKTGSLSVNLNTDWSIHPLGVNALTIEQLALTVQKTGDGSSGMLSGLFELLKGTSTAITLQVSAAYDSAAGWTFTAEQTQGTLKLLQFISTYLGGNFTFSHDLDLKGLKVQISPGVKPGSEGKAVPSSYSFEVETAQPFMIDFLDLSVAGSVKIAYQGSGDTLPAMRPAGLLPLSARAHGALARRGQRLQMLAAATFQRVGASDSGGFSGNLALQVLWHGVGLNVDYDFAKAGDDKAQKVTLQLLFDDIPLAHAEVDSADGKTTATFQFDSDTLGGVVETFVSWATGQRFSLGAPWDLLDHIPLGGFSITFDFTAKTVTFNENFGPIVIGPATVSGIGLTYDTTSKKVNVSVEGTFLWQTDNVNKPVEWDATDPSATPAPPGGGNKYFDLRLLALGQHLAITSKRIDKVAPLIEGLGSLIPPGDSTVPALPLTSSGTGEPFTLDYDANAGWLVAADFGLLRIGDDAKSNYAIQFSAVFDDPVLYAARIALAGKAAKIFAGLEFEIIYQQVSPTVGVWRSRITLPTAMRNFNAGAVAVTLPDFAIGIYTNGDFEVDVGFPWNQDFSVSFTVQAMAGPIPVIGSGGFYFSKLSSATQSQVPPGTSVPTTALGTFNPIIAFGFGAQFGLGKSVSMGILQAGFSVTAFGIIQGVLAKWHPYQVSSQSDCGEGELQGEYYFQLTGTFGLIGKLWGSIDFAIISASLDIDIKLFIQISYTSYQPIVLSAVASVDVELTVSINLGLFSIHIHFGFSAVVKATFQLDVGSTDAPWGHASGTLLQGPAQLRLFSFTKAESGDPITVNWAGQLQDTPASARPALTGWFVPTLTASGDGASAMAGQQACYVTMLFLDAPAPVNPDAPQPPGQSSFEQLCTLVGAWIGASVQSGSSLPLAAVLDSAVTDAQLHAVIDQLSGDDPYPIPLQAIDAFMSGQTIVNIAPAPLTTPKDGQGNPDPPKGVVLPAPPALSISAPGLSYALGELTVTSTAYLTALKALFNRLAVQVEQEQKGDDARPMRSAPAANPEDSVAGFVYAAWFAMLARQIAQAMSQGLRNYQYQPATTSETVSASLTALGNQIGSGVDAPTLFEANPRHPLVPAAAILVRGALLTSGTAETFSAVAARAFAASTPYFAGAALALVNPDAFLIGGKPFTFNGVALTSSPGDTLAAIAKRLGPGTDVAKLISQSDIASTVPLIAASALTVPDFTYTTAPGDQGSDTFEALAARFGVTVPSFAAATNLDQSLFLFDDKDNRFLALPHLTSAKVGALIGEAARSGAFRHASGMVSRFMLHGLRLPTAGVVPTATALFTQSSGQGFAYSVHEAGLFAMTGQQLGLPNPLPGDYAITLASGTSWMTLDGGTQIVFKVADHAHEADRIGALQKWLASNILQIALDSLAPKPAITFTAASYSVKSGVPWTNLGEISLPVGGTVAAATGLTVLQLPSEINDLAAQTLTVGEGTNAKMVRPAAPPAFSLGIVRYDEATGESFTEPASSYGWGTMISLKLRRAQGTMAAADTYELVGADQAGIILLERLLEANGDSDAAFAGTAVLYGSDVRSSPGLISDDMATAQAGLIQANLSTVTLPPPPSIRAMGRLDSVAPAWTTIYNPKLIELLRFVWEASITRSGGFYLYYFDEGRQQGLPDRLFNDHGEATVQLLVAHNDPDSIPSYANVALLGQAIAGGNLAVTATATRPTVTVSLDDTLAAIGLRAYLSPSAAAEQLATQPLMDGTVLTVGGGVYQVVSVTPTSTSPGADPTAIANWFGTTVGELEDPQGVNKNVPQNWWVSLPPLSAIRLPTVPVTVSAAKGLGTLAAIASYYGTTVEQLGACNQDRPGLFASGTSLPLVAGPVTANATQPPGVVGYLAERPPPPAPSPDPTLFDAKVLVESLFTMLGYSVFENQDFVAVQSLPAGPQNATSSGIGKVRAAVATDSDWRYLLNVPSYRCLPGWTPGQPDNPYAALARVLQVDLHWQDIFGNRLLQPPPDQPIGAGCYNLTPVLTGYTDRLIGVAGLPSVGASWQVTNAGQLTVRLTFNLERYQAGSNPPNPLPDYQKIATRDLTVYAMALRQLDDPAGVKFRVDTTLAAAGEIPLTDGGQAIRTWLASIANYLGAISSGVPATAPATLQSFDVPLGDLAANDVSEVSVALVIAREQSLVLGAADDVPGVAEASTILAPAIDSRPNAPVDPLEPPPPPAKSLADFATSFEAALSTPSTTVKLAAGPDRFAGKGPQQLWTVQVALAGDTGIAYQLADWPGSSGAAAGRPIVYARRPLSQTLESRPAVPIWPFDGSKVLQPGSAGYQSRAFSQIDIETWALAFCEAFDRILTPSYATPALILDHLQGSASMGRLRDAKEKAARALSRLILPVFKDDPVLSVPKDPPSPIEQAREAYRQTLLGKLANAFVPDVVVQCPATVAANVVEPAPPGAQALPPRLFGGLEIVLPALSSSPAKLDLANAGAGSPELLTFVVSASFPSGETPDHVPVGAGMCRYDVSNLEHQVGALDGIQGYQASSWLSFPVALSTAGQAGGLLTASLPAFDVPIVVRAYPPPPQMRKQTGEHQQSLKDDLAAARRWRYSATFARETHPPQDRLAFEISFNHFPASPFRLMATPADEPPPPPDSYAALAEFVTAYPDVSTALDATLLPIQPTSDSASQAKAAIALGSFVALCEYVAGALDRDFPEDFAEKTLVSIAQTPDYQFEWFDGTDEAQSAAQATYVLIIESAPPDGVGDPSIELAGYTSVTATGDETWLPDPYRQAVKDKTSFAFAFTKPSAPNTHGVPSQPEWLMAEQGRAISERTVHLPDLDLLQRQDALTSIAVSRNAELVAGRPSRDEFVYGAPPVAFPDPLRPSIVDSEEHRIDKIGSTDPVVRSLTDQLRTLWTALFSGGPQQDSVQCSISYGYPLGPAGLPNVALPVLMLPRTAFTTAAEGSPDVVTQDDLTAAVATQMQAWFNTVRPAGGGTYTIDLQVLAAADGMPLLGLTDLTLPLSSISGS